MTITKKWDDGLTNTEREIPDMSLSTTKPNKSTKGYTVTFHGNGLKFADGHEKNTVVYNHSGQIIEGTYKEVIGAIGQWYSEPTCKNIIDVSNTGLFQTKLTGDLDLWAKKKTFVLVDGYMFNSCIPDTVNKIIFTDEMKPNGANTVNVDADGDDGVIAWLEDSETIMKISTQAKGINAEIAENSNRMFSGKGNLRNIDFAMLDTSNATSMYNMFYNCSNLTNLDLSNFNTKNVTSTEYMFYNCNNLTSLNISGFSVQNVTSMYYMFYNCSKLIDLNLSNFDAQNVKYMNSMFTGCKSLKTIDLSNFKTKKRNWNVWNVSKL